MLIGLVGKAGSGKSTIAKYLRDNHSFHVYSFCTPLKEMLLKAGMCTHDELYNQKTEMSRWLMQKVGTEIIRKQVDWNYWIKKTPISPRSLQESNFVFDDVRFKNEADYIKQYGGNLVRVIRPDYQDPLTDENHASETEQNLIKSTIIISANSGDIQKLLEEINNILTIL